MRSAEPAKPRSKHPRLKQEICRPAARGDPLRAAPGPHIEEAAKLVVPAALLLSLYRRKPANGPIIGVASGAGFAVLETMGYAVVALVESRGQLAAVDGTLLLRGLLSPAAHMAWTGLTAAALWHTAARRWSGPAVGALVGTYVLAVVLHTLWDSFDNLVAYVVLAVIALSLLGATTHRLARGGPRGSSMPGSTAAVPGAG